MRTWRVALVALALAGVYDSPRAHDGQQTPAAGPAFTAAGAFVALSVADMAASVRWYQETLGLTVVMEEPRANHVAVTVLEGGGLIVELIQHDAAVRPERDSVLVHGIAKAGVIVDDFDGVLAALKARGVAFYLGPFPARPNRRANVLIKDNAGNLLQFFGK